MATTTNYSWQTPDDTALVKDGASAIRTLGTSIDTTVKALNPGTTSGDLDYYTAATTKARLAKGTAGQVLTMNSGATAPEWATSSSGGMTVLASGSLSGASVSLTSISTSYNDLKLVIKNYIPATDATELAVRVNNLSSGYLGMYNPASQTNVSFGSTEFIANQGDNAVSQSIYVWDFPDYANTITWKLVEVFNLANNPTTTTNANIAMRMSGVNTTNAITRIDIFPYTGNFTSGTYILYGVK